MKKPDLFEKFVELRAQGVSYTKIVEELGISKSTAIRWAKDHSETIGNFRTIHLDSLYQQFYLSRESRIRALGALVEKLIARLTVTDFSDVPSERAADLLLKFMTCMDRERAPLAFTESVTRSIDDPTEFMFSTKTKTWPA